MAVDTMDPLEEIRVNVYDAVVASAKKQVELILAKRAELRGKFIPVDMTKAILTQVAEDDKEDGFGDYGDSSDEGEDSFIEGDN